MGVTIHHKLGQYRPYVESTLNATESIATKIKEQYTDRLGIKMEIRRMSPLCLYIDLGHCETLGFDFKSVKEIQEESEKEGFSYIYASLTGDGRNMLDPGYEIEKYPENEKLYCADFCKTQFANNIIEHKIIADLIRTVASRCFYAEVSDEGDYYHSGDLRDAADAIGENGKLIDGITGMLQGLGYENGNVVKGGSTKIKKVRE